MPKHVYLNQVYREIPVEQRICEMCGRPIKRNAAIIDGRLYHYGCLKRSRAKPTHLCLSCFSYLTRKYITATYEGGEYPVKSCGYCGSPNIRPLSWREKAEFED